MTDARSKFRRRNRRAAVAALLLLAALGVRVAQVQRTSYAPINDARAYFRAPLDPFLIVLAACAPQTLAAHAVPRLCGAPVGRQAGTTVPVQGAELVEMDERLA